MSALDSTTVGRSAAALALAWTSTTMALPTAGAGQLVTDVRASAIYESYDLGAASSIDRISESSLAVTALAEVGSRVSVTAASGFASVESEGSEGSVSATGLLDTEFRIEVEALRGRVVAFSRLGLPTGMESLPGEDRSALRLLTHDVIGFSSANLGTGGDAGGGLAAAFPLGRMSLGASFSVQTGFPYSPFSESDAELDPGTELRLRVGVDGPVARRSFLRISGMFATRSGAEMAGNPTESGNRFTGYLSLEQGIGSSALTLYAFDVYRSEGGLEDTPVGPGVLPKGNVLAAGALWSYPIAADTRLGPRVELRDSREAGGGGGGLERLGTTLRVGVDLRRRISANWSGVVQLEGVTGSIVEAGADADVNGYRISAHVEFLP